MGVLWPGLAQPEPADLRGHGRHPHQPRAGAGDQRAPVVRRLPARRACRGELPQRRRPHPLHQQPAGGLRRHPPHHPRRAQGAQPAQPRPPRRPRDPDPHQPVRDGLPHAVQRPRADRARQGAGEHLGAVRRRCQEAGHLRQHRADGAPAGRARGALRADLPQQLGPPLERGRAQCPRNARTSTRPAPG